MYISKPHPVNINSADVIFLGTKLSSAKYWILENYQPHSIDAILMLCWCHIDAIFDVTRYLSIIILIHPLNLSIFNNTGVPPKLREKVWKLLVCHYQSCHPGEVPLGNYISRVDKREYDRLCEECTEYESVIIADIGTATHTLSVYMHM